MAKWPVNAPLTASTLLVSARASGAPSTYDVVCSPVAGKSGSSSRIKKCSPFKPTWFVSLANEWIGYVPTAQGFVGGGYEPRTARSSKMSIDTGQRLVETALKALGKVVPK